MNQSLNDLNERQLAIIHELILRGLNETDATDRKYGEAYDAFVDASGQPVRIGDLPDNVQAVWGEIFEASRGQEESD